MSKIIITKEEFEKARLEKQLIELSKKTGFRFESTLSKHVEKKMKRMVLDIRRDLKKQLGDL